MEMRFPNSADDDEQLALSLTTDYRHHKVIGLYFDENRGADHGQDGDHYYVAADMEHGIFPTETMVKEWEADPWSLLHLIFSLNRSTHTFSRSYRGKDAVSYATQVVTQRGLGFRRYDLETFEQLCARMGAEQFEEKEIPTPVLAMRQELNAGLKAFQAQAADFERQAAIWRQDADTQSQMRRQDTQSLQAALVELKKFRDDFGHGMKVMTEQVNALHSETTRITRLEAELQSLRSETRNNNQSGYNPRIPRSTKGLGYHGPNHNTARDQAPLHKNTSGYGAGVSWADDEDDEPSVQSPRTPASGTTPSYSPSENDYDTNNGPSSASSRSTGATNTPCEGQTPETPFTGSTGTPVPGFVPGTSRLTPKRSLDESFGTTEQSNSDQYDDRGQHGRTHSANAVSNVTLNKSGAAVAVTVPQWLSLGHQDTQNFFKKLEDFARIQPQQPFRALVPVAYREYFAMTWDSHVIPFPSKIPGMIRWSFLEASPVSEAITQLQFFIRAQFESQLRYAHLDTQAIQCKQMSPATAEYRFEKYVVAQLDHQRTCNRAPTAAKKFFIDGLKLNNKKFAKALDLRQFHSSRNDKESFEYFISLARQFLKESIPHLPAPGDNNRDDDDGSDNGNRRSRSHQRNNAKGNPNGKSYGSGKRNREDNRSSKQGNRYDNHGNYQKRDYGRSPSRDRDRSNYHKGGQQNNRERQDYRDPKSKKPAYEGERSSSPYRGNASDSDRSHKSHSGSDRDKHGSSRRHDYDKDKKSKVAFTKDDRKKKQED
jgi:hypothetical protein